MTTSNLIAPSPIRTPELPVRYRACLKAAAAFLLISCVGCVSSRLSPREAIEVALSDAGADQRRSATIRLASSNREDSDWAQAGFRVLALLDEDDQTRCVAIRALSPTERETVPTLIKLLNASAYATTLVRPTSEVVRWEAAEKLLAVVETDRARQTYGISVRRILKQLLREDPSRHVRLRAARALGSFAGEEAAFDALVQGLGDSDNAVVYECEQSLIRLTGITQRGSAGAWRRWRDANAEDLFAKAGETPPELVDDRRPDQKAWNATNEFFRAR